MLVYIIIQCYIMIFNNIEYEQIDGIYLSIYHMSNNVLFGFVKKQKHKVATSHCYPRQFTWTPLTRYKGTLHGLMKKCSNMNMYIYFIL